SYDLYAPSSSSGIFLFFFQRYRPLRALHSFPTRRSSDLRRRGLTHMTAAVDTVRDTPFVVGGRTFHSRLMVGTGKYRDNETMERDRKSTRLNSSHVSISYAVFCLKKKKKKKQKRN